VIFIQDERLEKLIEIPIIKLKKSNIVYELPNDILNSEEE
jgi:ribosome maturation factor rimP